MVHSRPHTNVETVVEAVSKGAALASIGCLLVLRATLQPELPWSFRVLIPLSLAAGWMAGRAWPHHAQAGLAILASVVPVALAAWLGSFDPVLYSVWMAGLVGCLLPSIRWSSWELPGAWRVLLGGWALTLSLAWPVLVGREVGFDLQRLGDVVNGNSWAQMSAPLVTGWMMHVVLVQLVGLLWLESVLRRGKESGEGIPLAVHGLWVGATVASVVAVYQASVDLNFLSSVEWADRGRATGTMLDANSFGVIAALAAPLSVMAIRSLAVRYAAMAAAVVFTLNWAGVWVSGSRTAFLCGLIGTGALGLGLLRQHRTRVVAMWPAAAVVLVLGTVVFGLSTATSPLGREEGIENPNDASVPLALLNRGGYGGIAVQMMREFPLTGVGVGTYHWLAPDYQRVRLDQELAFDNAQNWWRHQLAELGLLGGVPLLLWSLIVARMVLWPGRQSQPVRAGMYRGLLTGLGLVSLVGMPTQNPVVLLWFFALVALLARDGAPASPPPSHSPVGRTAWATVAVLAVLYASGHALLAREDLSITARAVRSGRDHAVGVYAPEPDSEGGEFRWTAGHAELTFAANTRWLVLRASVQHPDLGAQPVELRLSTPCQLLYAEVFDNPNPVTLALELPDPAVLQLSLEVSRTWTPADVAGSDFRTLGARLMTEFVVGPEGAASADARVLVTPCAVDMS